MWITSLLFLLLALACGVLGFTTLVPGAMYIGKMGFVLFGFVAVTVALTARAQRLKRQDQHGITAADL